MVYKYPRDLDYTTSRLLRSIEDKQLMHIFLQKNSITLLRSYIEFNNK